MDTTVITERDLLMLSPPPMLSQRLMLMLGTDTMVMDTDPGDTLDTTDHMDTDTTERDLLKLNLLLMLSQLLMPMLMLMLGTDTMVTDTDHGDTLDTTDHMDMDTTERDLLMLSQPLMLMPMPGTDTMVTDTDHGDTVD